MAAAFLDRLLHRCHIVNIRGNSFRMRRHMELSKAIHPTASRAADAENALGWGESREALPLGTGPHSGHLLPPHGPVSSVPFSMPESVPFSMPIDTRMPLAALRAARSASVATPPSSAATCPRSTSTERERISCTLRTFPRPKCAGSAYCAAPPPHPCTPTPPTASSWSRR